MALGLVRGQALLHHEGQAGGAGLGLVALGLVRRQAASRGAGWWCWAWRGVSWGGLVALGLVRRQALHINASCSVTTHIRASHSVTQVEH